MSDNMMDAVGEILRAAAAEAILTRYQVLSADEVHEKVPGEVVTIADRHAEEIIARRLRFI